MPIRPINKGPTPPAEEGLQPSAAASPRPRIRPVKPPATPPHAATLDTSATEEAATEYKVGRGNPPLHTRFKKGQSGNPKGRPGGSKGLNTLVRESLCTRVSARTPDGVKRITRVEAVLHKMLEMGMKGNQRALSTLLAYYAQAVPDPVDADPGQGAAAPLSPGEEEILRYLLRGPGRADPATPGEEVSHVPLALPLRGGQAMVVAGAPRTARPDAKLIAALRKAHGMLERQRGMPLVTTSPVSAYDRKILRLAFLAPDLQRDILAGYRPASLHLERLRAIEIPLCWKAQREALGWHTPG